MKKQFFKALFVLLILAGCSAGNADEAYYEFPNNVWHRFTNPEIEMEVVKPGIFYDMYLVLEHDPSLPLKEFPVAVIMTTPSGEIRSRNISFKLHGSGRARVLLRRDFAYAEKGVCSFEIENRSQNIEMPGMNSIGVVLERVN
jgi:hypothetical protein